ncbi:uncharacterized protein LOC108674962 [Hyalella azteca]|uniref:Uncharacterized protein LOC108674962 n=1 Tax=Hyalella azteca TaxID=294128 RepID=A0A8B7P018_HYAAZ|nr:uncharacterized protein LOC108674962 [Hyalella azteca]
MDCKEAVLRAVIISCRDYWSENAMQFTAINCFGSTSHIKIVTQRFHECGHLRINLQQLINEYISSSNKPELLELVNKDLVHPTSVVLANIQLHLQGTNYPVERRALLEKGILMLWLSQPTVMRNVILGAVSAQETLQSKAAQYESFLASGLDVSLLYGAQNILTNQTVSVLTISASCTADSRSDNETAVSEDISSYRASVVADLVSAIVCLCGGQIQRCHTRLCPSLCQNCNENEDSEGQVHNKAAAGECHAAQLIAVVQGSGVSCHSPPAVLVGPVVDALHKKKLRHWDARRCHELIYAELEAASAHKQPLDGAGWPELLHQQAASCLRLLLLTPAPSSPLQLRTVAPASNVRDVAFQLYNYARVHALLSAHAALQASGAVPPLPPPADVSYGSLTQPEEWGLTWLYVHEWPCLVHKLGTAVLRCSAHGNETSNKRFFPSHLVAKFLHDLSHCFSVYYNRVHILPGSVVPKHLVDVLHARIYLLMAIKNTMDAAFYLMNIVPPTQM